MLYNTVYFVNQTHKWLQINEKHSMDIIIGIIFKTVENSLLWVGAFQASERLPTFYTAFSLVFFSPFRPFLSLSLLKCCLFELKDSMIVLSLSWPISFFLKAGHSFKMFCQSNIIQIFTSSSPLLLVSLPFTIPYLSIMISLIFVCSSISSSDLR